MANSNKKQSGGFISNAFGVAKKLSETGLSVMNHVAPGTVSKLAQKPDAENIVQGSAKVKGAFEPKKYDNPQQMIREHFPQVTGKLLGKHYKKINQVTSFISPDLNDKLSDYIFDKLNDFVSEWTSVEAVLKEVGAKDLSELAKDPARSQRISTALANQSKVIATLQGTLTGAVGSIGAMIDVPTSLALALKSVYQTGRAHGFALNANDQAIVEYIFKQIDLGAVAEKQALLATIRTFVGIMETHNVNQLQQFLGSGNDIELLKRWIANDDGSFKFTWLNHLPQLHFLNRLTPLVTMGISAVYSWKLVDDATDKAQIVFSGAQQYLLQYPHENIDTLEAYEKFVELNSQMSPVLLDHAKNVEDVKVQASLDTTVSQSHLENDKVGDGDDVVTQEKAIEKTEAKTVSTEIPDKKTSVDPQESATATAKTSTPAKTTSAKTETLPKTSTTTKTVTKKPTVTKSKVVSQNTAKDAVKVDEVPENTLEKPENKAK